MVSKKSYRIPEVRAFAKSRGNRGRFFEGEGHFMEKE